MSQGFDEIGRWSEIKLDIVRDYASAYSVILARQTVRLHHIYIDGFAGAGMHVSKSTGEVVKGSPANALQLPIKFEEYHFVEIDSEKVKKLRALAEGMTNVWIHEGDCNKVLPENLFPRVRFEDYRRALCLLDPYGLHLDWNVVHAAGQMGTIEVFINFPIMDMNRNVLHSNPENADPGQVARMNAFWGDDSWRSAAYDTTQNLFGWEFKAENSKLVTAYQKRLKTDAGFKYVPDPVLMRNSNNAPLYYLFFASCNETGGKIARDVFAKYREKGVR
ncbi:MAG: three-Cys-motif partner protein TcmP [Dehalococcoidia bacterium]